jgi:ubiquinone/menaquinone biosynthesis C-methylase UbiE
MQTNRVISREEASELDLDARISIEARITDAKQIKVRPKEIPSDFSFRAYVARSPWRRCLFGYLGPLADKTILDLGCGYYPTPIYFVLAGAAHVYATDVSAKAVEAMQERAAAMGLAHRITAVQCPAERLPFDPQFFDLVHGEAVLHHLKLDVAGPEIARVLKRGGRSGFKDPLGQNPVLEFARDYLPYRGKNNEKGTDRPMTLAQCRHFASFFRAHQIHTFGLTAMAAVPFFGRRSSAFERGLDRVDRVLLRACPPLKRLCRFVVTCAEK